MSAGTSIRIRKQLYTKESWGKMVGLEIRVLMQYLA